MYIYVCLYDICKLYKVFTDTQYLYVHSVMPSLKSESCLTIAICTPFAFIQQLVAAKRHHCFELS